jgi:RNA polymerase sigma-70 factor (ECF subfamily)
MMLRKRVEAEPVEASDEELLYKARNGNESAFNELYERHRDGIFRFVYRLSSSVSTAEDITQDCFLSLLRNGERFEGTRASLRTYLLAAARNLALKRFGKVAAEADLEDLESEPISAETGPLDKVLHAELAVVVKAAIESLPSLQREALVLFEYEEITLAQISEVVGADVGTVKARLYRARQRLKQLLGPYYREGSGDRAADEVLR